MSPDIGDTSNQLALLDAVQVRVRCVGTGLSVIVCAGGAPAPAVAVKVIPEGLKYCACAIGSEQRPTQTRSKSTRTISVKMLGRFEGT